MTKVNELPEVSVKIQSIRKEQWDKLFNLIPLIESENSFGEFHSSKPEKGVASLPYMVPSKVVHNFSDLVYKLGLIICFDWVSWREGREVLEDPETDFNRYDIVTLCKFLTVLVRIDRYVEGSLVDNFERGTVLRVLKAMARRIGSSYN